MAWENWVIDATMGWPPCFCPVEGDLDGEFSIVTGMNCMGAPPDGLVVAVVHADGQESASIFYAKHKGEIDEILRPARELRKSP